MRKRHSMSRGHSKRHFSKHGSRTHVKNVIHSGAKGVMRGGIRL